MLFEKSNVELIYKIVLLEMAFIVAINLLLNIHWSLKILKQNYRMCFTRGGDTSFTGDDVVDDVELGKKKEKTDLLDDKAPKSDQPIAVDSFEEIIAKFDELFKRTISEEDKEEDDFAPEYE